MWDVLSASAWWCETYCVEEVAMLLKDLSMRNWSGISESFPWESNCHDLQFDGDGVPPSLPLSCHGDVRMSRRCWLAACLS